MVMRVNMLFHDVTDNIFSCEIVDAEMVTEKKSWEWDFIEQYTDQLKDQCISYVPCQVFAGLFSYFVTTSLTDTVHLQ